MNAKHSVLVPSPHAQMHSWSHPPVVAMLGVPGITLEWQLVDWWRLQRSTYSTLHPLFVRASQAITATPRWVPIQTECPTPCFQNLLSRPCL